MKRLANILSTGIIILLLIIIGCNFYLLLARNLTANKHPTIFGNLLAVVYSGSMSGTFEVNDIIIVHPKESYSTGDIICFEEGESLVTHRIVEETPEGFVTKGDANNAEDIGKVAQDSVIGTVVFVIPKVGAAQQFVMSLPGLLVLMAVVIIIFFLPEWWEKRSRKGGQE